MFSYNIILIIHIYTYIPIYCLYHGICNVTRVGGGGGAELYKLHAPLNVSYSEIFPICRSVCVSGVSQRWDLQTLQLPRIFFAIPMPWPWPSPTAKAWMSVAFEAMLAMLNHSIS